MHAIDKSSRPEVFCKKFWWLLQPIPSMLNQILIRFFETFRQAFPSVQKQPSKVFCKKGVLRNFTKSTRKQLFQSLFFNKVAGISPAQSTSGGCFCIVGLNQIIFLLRFHFSSALESLCCPSLSCKFSSKPIALSASSYTLMLFSDIV